MPKKKTFLKSAYKLKVNPFMSRVDLKAPMANREAAKKRWTELLGKRKGGEANSLNFIVGDYGQGKSLTLYKIVEQCKTDRKLLPIYLKFLPEDPIQKFGLDFVQRLFSALPPRLFGNEIDKSTRDRLTNLHPSFATVLDEFLKKNDIAHAYLTGERTLTASEFKSLGAQKKFSSTEVARDFLLGLLCILYSFRIETVVLAVDEVEYVFSQMRGAKISNVFNTLRDFYDLPQSPRALQLRGRVSNVVFFYGISQAGWRNLNELERKEQRVGGPVQPLLDRKEEVIELVSLNETETSSLIELRLKVNRVTKTVSSSPLIPYTGDFASYIFGLTKGNPRHIVERCDLVLEDGLRDQVPVLNREFARKVLLSHGLESELKQER